MAINPGDVFKLRPYVPAKDFERSKRFYRDLRFTITHDMQDMAELSWGPHTFLLQNYYDKAWAENCVMHMVVRNADAWWQDLMDRNIPKQYDMAEFKRPEIQTWGGRSLQLFDPSGVLWHIAEEAESHQ